MTDFEIVETVSLFLERKPKVQFESPKDKILSNLQYSPTSD